MGSPIDLSPEDHVRPGAVTDPREVLRLGGTPLPLTVPARLYVCGITPYDVTHLGHAATFVWADTAARVIRMTGVETVVTRNVTDVDDVLTRVAAERGRAFDEFGLTQEYYVERDMAALHVRPPTHSPHARHHVAHVVRLAIALLAAGAAYEREGHVFFRGAEAAAALDRSDALARSAEFGDAPDDPLRDDPFDVPVWRPSGEQDPAWPSPWGWGRPGWHAECAAMAAGTLGAGLDVLVGGADLAFPHHAMQAAMAEAATGVSPFARATVHVGAVRQDGAKMAKSRGNLTLVSDLLAEHRPAAVRLLLVDRGWSSAWDFDAGLLDAAEQRLDRLYAAAGRAGSEQSAQLEITAALLDDLDVPRALAAAEEAGGAAARLLIATLALG